MGCEVQNIQVSLDDRETVMLRDASGVFITVEPEAIMETGGSGDSDGGDGVGGGDGTKTVRATAAVVTRLSMNWQKLSASTHLKKPDTE